MASEPTAPHSPPAHGESGSVVFLLLRRFALRHWRVAPGQHGLLVLILALGVAVFVSVRLANRAAVSSFQHFTETLAGQSDWIIQAPTGFLPESLLPELRAALGDRPVHIVPVLELAASPPARGNGSERFGRPTYTLLGTDLLALANLARPEEARFFGATQADARTTETTGEADDFWGWLRSGPRVWVSPRYSGPGDKEVEVVLTDRITRIPIAGRIPSPPDEPSAPENLMVADLGALQELSGRVGQLDRIEFIVEPGARASAVREDVRNVLTQLSQDGQRWMVTEPGARRQSAELMTRAFRLNLTVLSLIALLVGLYLIFQALDGAVVRRRAEIAILRSLGVEESTVRRVWLAESAVLGVIGGILGLLLGWAGAQISVRAVGQTVNALYFATTVKSAQLTWGETFVGLLLGLAAALVAGWFPARAAARTPPAQVLQRSAAASPGAWVLRHWPLGLTCLGMGVACSRLPAWEMTGGGRFPVAGYAAAGLWIFGGGILCGFLLRPFSHVVRRVARNSPAGRIGFSHLAQPSGRHRLAVAALLCAIGMTAGMAILVASFERTVRTWIEQTLDADLYLGSAGAQSASSRQPLSPATVEAIATHPAVAEVRRLTSYPLILDGRPTTLSGVDLAALPRRPILTWVAQPTDPRVYQPEHNRSLVLVSESFTQRYGHENGDTLLIPTPTGAQTVQIAGIFADYGNERGSILADRRHVAHWYGEDSVTNLSLLVKPGVIPETLRQELQREHPGLGIFTNRSLREEVLRIFRQTFSITYALEVIGVAVALIGLALTLASVLLDRRDELTTLRALGFSRHEMAGAAALEGGMVALVASFGGLLLSGALGWLLIFVINKQSFGWTLGYVIPWGLLGGLLCGVVITGTLVSYWVGRWGADLPADREE